MTAAAPAGPRPKFDIATAVLRAITAAGHGTYMLGTGDDTSSVDGQLDCCGFATCYCHGIHRHRPGFNRNADNSFGDVEDDINCNSSIDDAFHHRDLFDLVKSLAGDESKPRAGDLIKWPTIRLIVNGAKKTWWGHECIVVGTSRLESFIAAGGMWSWDHPRWDLLDVVQCCGPDGRHPGILATDGSAWMTHDKDWHAENQRSHLLRVRALALGV